MWNFHVYKWEKAYTKDFLISYLNLNGSIDLSTKIDILLKTSTIDIDVK